MDKSEKAKKRWLWFYIYAEEIYIITAPVAVIIAFLLNRFGLRTNNGPITVIAVAWTTFTIMYAVIGAFVIKELRLNKFDAFLGLQAWATFFHGKRFGEYLDTNAFLRLADHLGGGFCYEIAAIVMILAKPFKTARLCHGDLVDKDGNRLTRAWVEVKVPLNGWVVIDYAWKPNVLTKKKDYFRTAKNGDQMVTKWVCSYEDFWSIPLSRIIKEAMEKPETSHILPDLFAYRNGKQEYGFQDDIRSIAQVRANADEVSSIVNLKNGTHNLITSKIMSAYVDDPTIKTPPQELIEEARAIVRKAIFPATNAQTSTLFVSDFDYTLVVHGASPEITAKNLRAAKEWRDQRGIFLIASGRSWPSISSFMSDVGDYADYLILDDGATTSTSDGEVIFSKKIDNGLIRRLNDAFYSQPFRGGHAIIGCRNNQEVNGFEPGCCKFRIWFEYAEDRDRFNTIIEEQFGTELHTIMYQHLERNHDLRIEWVDESMTCVMEILSIDTSKKAAIEQMLDFFCVKPSDIRIVTVGDNINDFSMLDAFEGYIVANADPDALEHFSQDKIVPSVSSLIETIEQKGADT